MSKIISTSHEAYHQSHALANAHKAKIVEVLKAIQPANYEMIASKTGLDKTAVARRTSELLSEEKIIRTDLKMKTSSGRNAFCYEVKKTA